MPVEDTSSAIIVFDSTCVLCSGWTRFLIRRDRARRFSFATVQSAAGSALLRSHGIDPLDPTSFLLLEGDRAYTQSDGVIRVLQNLGGPWRLATLARALPKSLRDALYRFVARHRYEWFGRRATCSVSDRLVRERLL